MHPYASYNKQIYKPYINLMGTIVRLNRFLVQVFKGDKKVSG